MEAMICRVSICLQIAADGRLPACARCLGLACIAPTASEQENRTEAKKRTTGHYSICHYLKMPRTFLIHILDEIEYLITTSQSLKLDAKKD